MVWHAWASGDDPPPTGFNTFIEAWKVSFERNKKIPYSWEHREKGPLNILNRKENVEKLEKIHKDFLWRGGFRNLTIDNEKKSRAKVHIRIPTFAQKSNFSTGNPLGL